MRELAGRQWQAGDPLTDTPQVWPVVSSERTYDAGFVSVHSERLRGSDADGAGDFDRVVVHHLPAVGIVALDDSGRVLLLEQYRHPVRQRLLEVPAGLMDVEGESAMATAQRELAEETFVVAAEWEPLLTMVSSPGFTDEHWDVFLARDLSAVAEDERHIQLNEEADMGLLWVPLDAAVAAVLDHRITDAMAVAALMATWIRTRR